jgi:hypothetical protein
MAGKMKKILLEALMLWMCHTPNDIKTLNNIRTSKIGRGRTVGCGAQ